MRPPEAAIATPGGRDKPPVRGRGPAALRHPRELTTRWLDRVLQLNDIPARVASFTWRRIGADSGIGGFVTRVTLRYRSAPAGAPQTLVVKFPRYPGWVEGAVIERRFYQDHAPSCPIATPRLYYAAINQRAGRFTIVLEDLDGHRHLDDVLGVTAEDAAVIVDGMAAMHAWASAPDAGFDWLQSAYDFTDYRRSEYELNVERSLRRLRGFVPRAHFAMLRQLADAETAARELLRVEPLTMAHQDFRADNIFIAPDGAPVVIDWEGIWRHRGGAELGRFLVTSLDPATLRAHGNALVARYATAIARRGAFDYPRELIERDFRLGLVRQLVRALGQLPAENLGRGRPLRVVRSWAIRADIAIREFDALDAVPAGWSG
jgi:hypothetical protein